MYTNDKITIRQMEVNDIHNIAIAENDLSNSFKNYFQRQLSWQKNGECSALLALFDNQIAGYVFMFHKCRWGGMRNNELPSIVDLYVLERYRKNGVGTALLDAAEVLAVQFSDKIYLDVPVDCTHGKAQKLYAKRGYVPDGKGIYYDPDGNGLCEVCPVNAELINIDDVTLCMVKVLQ